MLEYDFQTPNGNPVSWLCREETNDRNVVYSAGQEDEYDLAGLELEGWALDLGAHIGGVAVCLLLDHPRLNVIAVEPVPDNLELLRANAERNGVLERLELRQEMVARGRETIRFRYRQPSGELDHHAFIGNATSIVLPPVFDELELPCADLAGLRRLHGPPALVKIDVEGAEWAALEELAALEAPLLVGEWHPYPGTPSPAELASVFEQAGYQVTFNGPLVGPGGFRAAR
jgi:FkbM family methyltransferase